MKLITRYGLPLIFIFALSCHKGPGEQRIEAAELVYYDYYSDYTSFPQNNDSLDCGRVCYDIANEKTVWIKKDDKAPIASFISYFNTDMYSKAFSSGNDIIKIFPTSAIPSNTQIATRVNAVYFQKFDKQTGEQTALKIIVTAAEIGTSPSFIMTQVVTDGSNYYFSLGNSYVYCFNAAGDLVWKKNYPMSNGNYDGQYGYGYMYYNDHKVYVIATEPTLGWTMVYCLDPATGQIVWANQSAGNPALKELLITSDKIVDFSRVGVGGVLNKATGADVGVFAISGATSSGPLMVSDNNSIVFSSSAGIGFLGLQPVKSYLPTPLVDCPIGSNYITSLSPAPRLYSVHSTWGSSKMTVACLNMSFSNPGSMISWKKTYPYPVAVTPPGFLVYDYYMKDDKLYLFTNFQIANGSCVPNPTKPGPFGGQQLKSFSLIILSASTGELVKQVPVLPSGNWPRVCFNILHD